MKEDDKQGRDKCRGLHFSINLKNILGKYSSVILIGSLRILVITCRDEEDKHLFSAGTKRT